MNYQEFKSYMISEMQKHVGASAHIQIKEIQKNNGTTLDGMIISEDGVNIAPTIYLNHYYHRLLEGVELTDIIEDFIATYECHKPESSIDISFYTDITKVKERIVFRLVNKERNQILLNDVPHVDYLDLSIIFTYLFDTNENDYCSILIRNEHLNYWNLKTEDLYHLAMINTPLLLPKSINTMKSIMDSLEIEIENLEEGHLTPCEIHCPDMYVLTNEYKLHGAACLLYPEVLEDFSKQFHSDFFIIPSSIHETILLPVFEEDINACKKYLTNLVQEVNETQVLDEEILADHVYFYSKETKLVS